MELGITDKSDIIKDLLGLLTRSDFHHDYNKKAVTIGELATKLRETAPLNPSHSIDIYKKRINEFVKKNKEKNIYDIFSNTNLLTPSEKKEFIKTDKVIKEILGFEMSNIKRELKENEDKYGLLKDINKYKIENIIKPPINKGITINYKNKIKRDYQYSCYPAKVRGEYFNLPFVFRKLTNKNNFIFLIDSTQFSLKKMRRREIIRTLIGDTYDSTQTYTFYIIKNNETLSDPATKIEAFDSGSERIKIKILKDLSTNESIYPPFNRDNKSQNTNLFTSINLRTRKEGENSINANIEYSPREIDNFKDLSKISEIKQSSLLALQKYIDSLKAERNDSLIYFLLKRAGDWCQALSLLDRTRKYEIYDYDTGNKEGDITTLEDLKNRLNCDISFLTHDQILLTYCLLLGINVFFSIAIESAGKSIKGEEDGDKITWNIYFKNTSDITKVDTKVLDEINEEYFTNIEKVIQETDETIQSSIKNIKELKLPEVPSTEEFLVTTAGNYPYNTNLKYNYEDYIIHLITTIRENLIILANIFPSETIREKMKILQESSNRLKPIFAGNSETQKKENLSALLDLGDFKNNLNEYININKNIKYKYREKDEEIKIIKDFLSLDDRSNKKNEIEIQIENSFENIINNIKQDFDTNTTQNVLKKEDIDFYDIIPYLLEIYKAGFNVEIKKRRGYFLNKQICKVLLKLKNAVLKEDEDFRIIQNPEGTYLTNICDFIDDRRQRTGISAYEGVKKGGDRIQKIYNSFFSNNVGIQKTPYVNDEEGHFYSPIDGIIVKKEQLEPLRDGLNKPETKEEKYISLRFILYYLDELYTGIFAITAEERDDDLYLSYLYLQAQVYNLQDKLYDSGNFTLSNINEILDIFFNQRQKWTPYYLENFNTSLRGSYEDIEKRINSKISELKERVVRELIKKDSNNNGKTRKRARNNNNIVNNISVIMNENNGERIIKKSRPVGGKWKTRKNNKKLNNNIM
jgi:hypothetical protein